MLPATVRVPPSVTNHEVDVTLIFPFTVVAPAINPLLNVVLVIVRLLYVPYGTTVAAAVLL